MAKTKKQRRAKKAKNAKLRQLKKLGGVLPSGDVDIKQIQQAINKIKKVKKPTLPEGSYGQQGLTDINTPDVVTSTGDGDAVNINTGEVFYNGGQKDYNKQAHNQLVLNGCLSELYRFGNLAPKLIGILNASISQFGVDRVVNALETMDDKIHDIIIANAKSSVDMAQNWTSALAHYLDLGGLETDEFECAVDREQWYE